MSAISSVNHELATKRLRLRLLQPDDAEMLFPYLADPELSRWMTWAPHESIQDTRAYLHEVEAAFAAGASLQWAIFEAEIFCGVIDLDEIKRTRFAVRLDTAELAYWLTPAARSRGIATEASRAVLAHAFGPLGLHKVSTGCFAENEASRRVLERIGFRLVGIEQQQYFKDASWHDNARFELLAEQFSDSTK